MAISGSLRRLLHIRTLQEEQQKVALESALADLHRLESTLAAARALERSGRERVARSALSGDATDRIAGVVESEAARRSAQLLEARIITAAERASQARDEYLARRVERRQVETVLRESAAAQDAENARREQQGIDEWFSARRHGRSTHRHNGERDEIKDRQESASFPVEELRPKL